ncbi:MAG: S41 family peptidase [Chitinophagales bacterium]
MQKKLKIGSLIVGAGLAVGCLSFADHYFEISRNLDIFAAAYKDVNLYYVDDAEPSKLMRTCIDGMLKTLDPFTNYISESQIETFRIQNSDKLVGIGIHFQIMDSLPVITEVLPDLPAAKMGLEPGDKITSIDGKATYNRSFDEISQGLRGQTGTNVELVLKKVSDEVKTVAVQRQEFQETNVPFFGMLTPQVGCINLKVFNQNAGKDVRDAFDSLKRSNPNMKGVILDLRGNPGGLLNEAVNVVNVFIERNKLVVTTKGRVAEWNNTFKTNGEPSDLRIPIAVLTDNKSASASEIVSGSLQDYDRAIVIGQKTYGKGLVQITKNLSYNTMLKVTTAKYYIPSGRCIQALLYAERNEDGSVKRIPDSLKHEFKTANGRKVWDGGGVDPDVPVAKAELTNLIKALQDQHLIFDYATKYRKNHNGIGEAATFKLGETDFGDFVAFVRSKNFKFKTESDDVLERLKAAATEEKYFDAVKSSFEATQKRLDAEKNAALEKSKSEILPLLEAEIAGRYYSVHGKIEKQLQNDALTVKALELLNDPAKYQEILTAKK